MDQNMDPFITLTTHLKKLLPVLIFDHMLIFKLLERSLEFPVIQFQFLVHLCTAHEQRQTSVQSVQ